MFKKFFILLVVMVAFGWSSYAIAGPNMKEGLWEITTKMEMPGMPVAMPARTHTQCITKGDPVPQKPESREGQECKFVEKKIVGDTVIWTMKCQTKEGTMVMKGRITYKGNTFDGKIKMKTPDGMEMTQHISGRRVGECK